MPGSDERSLGAALHEMLLGPDGPDGPVGPGRPDRGPRASGEALDVDGRPGTRPGTRAGMRPGTRPGTEPTRHAGSGVRSPAVGTAPGEVPGRRRRPARRWRSVAVVAGLAALAVPLALTLATVWARTGQDLDAARAERDGTLALRPLVALVAATADAQSAAVAGEEVDTAAVRDAVRRTDTAQAQVGDRLRTARRWGALRAQVDELLAATPNDTAAYAQFSSVVDGELALLTVVGDSAALVLDPQLDSAYLIDTALRRLPQLLVDAGRAEDLTWLDERRRPASRTLAEAAAVELEAVRGTRDALDTGLRKGFASTSSTELGPGLVSQLDGLQNAVSQLAPPLAAVGADPVTRTARDLRAARTQVRRAALQLEGAALDQLVGLLEDRQAAPDNTRRLVGLSTLAGLLLAGAVAWVVGPRRPADPTTADGPDDALPDDVRRAGLLEARDLIEDRELARVGRAVTARSGIGRGGAGRGGTGQGGLIEAPPAPADPAPNDPAPADSPPADPAPAEPGPTGAADADQHPGQDPDQPERHPAERPDRVREPR